MKKIRIVFTGAAFFLAIVFAIAGSSMTSTNILETTAYGYNPETGQCVAGNLLQEGCGTSGLYNCTIWVEDVGPVNAYQLQQSTYSCAVALKRWNP